MSCAKLSVVSVLSIAVSLCAESFAAPPQSGQKSTSSATAPAVDPAARNDSGALLNDVAARRRLFGEQLQAEVDAALRDARGQLAQSPSAAVSALKQLAERVAIVPEISGELRRQLRQSLAGALREAQRAVATAEEAGRVESARRAAADERRVAAQSLTRNEERLVQLSERFSALLDENRYRLAEEEVAPELAALGGNRPIKAASTLAQAVRAAAESQQTAAARRRGVVATLQTVEVSHVPFPDEPSIVYPSNWEELSLRRKHYATRDLRERPASEERILKALEEPSTLDFDATPLSDLLDTLKRAHGIEIQIDHKALDDTGIAADLPVTRHLAGVSLRSALRLTLGELGLAYLVKDEVLLVTTAERAAADVTTRAYPVEDLVVPIRSTSIGGLSPFGLGNGAPGGMNQNGQGAFNPLGGPNGMPFGQQNGQGLPFGQGFPFGQGRRGML